MGWTWPLALWLAPLLLGQPFLRAYLLAEHGACPLVADMLANTRTTFTNGLVRFLAWNMPFHAEHHAWPSIPFHALPAANALVHDKLRTTAPGYAAALGDIWRVMRAGQAL
jgi:fatty acid desaturase